MDSVSRRVIQAVRASGRADIKVLSKSAEIGISAWYAKGEQAANFGVSIDWTGWAAVDNMVVVCKRRVARDHENGLAVHV